MTYSKHTQFPIIPASKKALACRKSVEGIGINDADYVTRPAIKGKRFYCLYYNTWREMLKRCYSARSQKIHPTYNGCSVAPEWLLFMNFRKWMKEQDWQGKHLDKDIMYPGNKVYSSETCVFVTRKINCLLNDSASTRGKYPQGVSYKKKINKYQASLNINGKSKYLGVFHTPEDAGSTYREAKRLHVLTIACCEPDIRVKQGLYRHSELLR